VILYAYIPPVTFSIRKHVLPPRAFLPTKLRQAAESHADSYSVGQRALLKIARPILTRLSTPILRALTAWHVAPNLLSLLQIPLGIAMILLIDTSRIAVLILILCCFLLDMLDGLLARYTGRTSPHGALIDQMADQIREVLTVAALVQSGALPGIIGTLYGVLYPLSNVGLYLVNQRGGAVSPTFKSVLTFYPFLAIYLLGGSNWLIAGGWLTIVAMGLTVAQCAWALEPLMAESNGAAS